MSNHLTEFPKLLEPPHPFAASDFEFNGLDLQGEWHLDYSANLGCCAAFACPEARAVLDSLLPRQRARAHRALSRAARTAGALRSQRPRYVGCDGWGLVDKQAPLWRRR